MESLHIYEPFDARSRHQNKRLVRCRQHVLHFFQEDWGWEVISFVGAVLSLLVVVIFLACYDGKVHTDRPSSITLNAIVAAIFAVFKALVIICASACVGQFRFLSSNRKSLRLIDVESYNAASQNAIGAFWLLMNSRAAKASLLGAFVIATSIAVDPLIQQLLNYPGRWTVRQDPAWLNIKAQYSAHDDVTKLKLKELDGKLRMHEPLYGGIFEPDAVGHWCSAQKCKWPDYLTLGVCSTCTDMTSNFTAELVNVRWRETFKRWWTGPRDIYVLESGRDLRLPSLVTETISSFNAVSKDACFWDPTATQCSKIGQNPMLMEFSVVSFSQQAWSEDFFRKMSHHKAQKLRKWVGNLTGTNLYRVDLSDTKQIILGEWHAHNCAMNLCVQTRRASTDGEFFRDEVIHEQVSPLDCSWVRENETADHNWLCLLAYEGLEFDFQWEQWLPGDHSYDDNVYSFCLASKSKKTWWDWNGINSAYKGNSTRSFMIDLSTIKFWRDQLKHFTIDRRNGGGRRQFSVVGNLNSTQWNTDIPAEDYPPFFKNQVRFSDNIAEYLTGTLRKSELYPAKARGIQLDRESVVQVNWAYTSLPVFLLCCTFIELVLTIRETRQARAKPWKTSTLPLLFDGLDFTNESDYQVQISESKKRAKMTPLMLHRLWRIIPGNTKEEGAIRIDKGHRDGQHQQ